MLRQLFKFTVLLALLQACNNQNPYPYSNYNGYQNGYNNSYGRGGFQALQQSILSPMCSRCHPNAMTGYKGFGVDSYQDVMSSGYVQPGNPNSSILCEVVSQGRMPPNQPLDQNSANQICNWIQNGAQQ